MQLCINLLEYEEVCDFNIKKLFSIIVKQTLKTLNSADSRMIDVSFISAIEIKKINKQYRDANNITDVISFNYDDVSRNEYILGEIYICLAQAIKQAKTYKHSLKREVCFLFTHGLLHLFGYNHIIEQDANVMFTLQEEILTKCKIERTK